MDMPRPHLLIVLLVCGCRPAAPETSNTALGPVQSILGDRLAPEVAGGVGSIQDYGANDSRATKIWAPRTLSTDLELIAPVKGIVVRAKGEECKGPPHMEFLVDGKLLLSADVPAGSWGSYKANADLPRGMHHISLRFTNDLWIPPDCDRNLLIDKITFPLSAPLHDGDLGPAELLADGTGSVVADAHASHGVAFAMMSSGSVTSQLRLDRSAAGLVVRARADLCKGPPEMDITVDGKVLAHLTVDSVSWMDYPVPVNLEAGLHRISIGFPNDLYEPPACDRNLYIDAVRAL
jgi:hypothetical protein